MLAHSHPFADSGVFFQQVVRDFAGFGAEVVEKGGLLLLHAVGALAAGERIRAEGEMAQQLERIGDQSPCILLEFNATST